MTAEVRWAISYHLTRFLAGSTINFFVAQIYQNAFKGILSRANKRGQLLGFMYTLNTVEYFHMLCCTYCKYGMNLACLFLLSSCFWVIATVCSYFLSAALGLPFCDSLLPPSGSHICVHCVFPSAWSMPKAQLWVQKTPLQFPPDTINISPRLQNCEDDDNIYNFPGHMYIEQHTPLKAMNLELNPR